MKVAFVLLDGEVTGGQVVARELMLAARAAGHSALAIAPRDGPLLLLLREDGFEALVVPLERTHRLDQAARLAAELRRRRVDVVDTHTLFVGNQLSRAAAALAGIPLVAHAHIDESFHPRPAIARLQRALDRRSTRFCAAIVAVSHAVRATLVAEGIPPSLVMVIHNGVHLTDWTPCPARPGLRLVCAARLAPVKGQDTLLEALALAGEGIEVSLVGVDLERDGAYAEELASLARRLGVERRVAFLGYRSDLPRLVSEADGLVLPSRLEGLPLVVLEAMALARAVVATAVGGTPEAVVDGETGLLVEPGSPRALAAALTRLRDEAGLRARLGRAGLERAARLFTVDRMASRTLAVLEAASAPTGSPPRR